MNGALNVLVLAGDEEVGIDDRRHDHRPASFLSPFELDAIRLLTTRDDIWSLVAGLRRAIRSLASC